MNSPNDKWEPCESGQIREMARGLRASRSQATSRRVMLAASGAAGLVLVGVVASIPFWRPEAEPEPIAQPVNYGRKGGLSCRKVVEIYDDYAAGNLDNEMTTRVSLHLDDCPHCRNRLGAEKRNGST